MYARLFAAIVILACIVPAHAGTTYNLVFTGTAGTEIGSGTIALNAAPPPGSSTFYEATDPDHTQYIITSFSATVDGYTFDLANESALTSATFDNGILTDFEYQSYPSFPPGPGFQVFFDTFGTSFNIGNTTAPYPNDNGTFTPTLATIPFCKLSAALEATIGQHHTDSFILAAAFSPGPDGVIDPATQPVSIAVGPFSATIPAGSFEMRRGVYIYQGLIGSVNLDFVIQELSPQCASTCSTATYTLSVLHAVPH